MPPLREMPRGHPAHRRRDPRAPRAQAGSRAAAARRGGAAGAARATTSRATSASSRTSSSARSRSAASTEITAADLHLDAAERRGGAGRRRRRAACRCTNTSTASSARRSWRRSARPASTAPRPRSSSASPSARCATGCSAWASRMTGRRTGNRLSIHRVAEPGRASRSVPGRRCWSCIPSVCRRASTAATRSSVSSPTASTRPTHPYFQLTDGARSSRERRGPGVRADRARRRVRAGLEAGVTAIAPSRPVGISLAPATSSIILAAEHFAAATLLWRAPPDSYGSHPSSPPARTCRHTWPGWSTSSPSGG